MSLDRSWEVFMLAVRSLARGAGTPRERLTIAFEDYLLTLNRAELPNENLRVRFDALRGRLDHSAEEPIGDEDARSLIDEIVAPV